VWPRGEVRVRVEKESLSGRLASCEANQHSDMEV
jgi:hypothetical protein